MAKEDVPPLPKQVPRKRRQIEKILDVHIAMWLAQADLPAGDLKRLQEEKKRRKEANPEYHIGFVGGSAGMPPGQKKAVEVLLLKFATNVDKYTVHVRNDLGGGANYNFFRLAKKLHHQSQYDIAIDIQTYPHFGGWIQNVVKASTHVIIAPNSDNVMDEDTNKAYNYALDRGIPVMLATPSGLAEVRERSAS